MKFPSVEALKDVAESEVRCSTLRGGAMAATVGTLAQMGTFWWSMTPPSTAALAIIRLDGPLGLVESGGF